MGKTFAEGGQEEMVKVRLLVQAFEGEVGTFLHTSFLVVQAETPSNLFVKLFSANSDSTVGLVRSPVE